LASSCGAVHTVAINIQGGYTDQFVITFNQRLETPAPVYSFLGFGYSPHIIWPQVILPLWFPALSFAALAWLIHLQWQFSLRTLLIVTTLVAVVLGLIVWLR
jgi:hypothetical protein